MLPPIELHKAILIKSELEERALPIQLLAEELQLEMTDLKACIDVLLTLQVITVDEPRGELQLTINGLLANWD